MSKGHAIPPLIINAQRYLECVAEFSADTLETPLNFDSQTGEVDHLVGVGSELFALVSLLG